MYKLASLFAGVGGIDLGFENTGKFTTVYANEIDKSACKTFVSNFSDSILDNRDIRVVDSDDIPDIDVLTSGFPCTSFSIAGYRKGFEDERTGDLFFETLRIIKAKKPKAIFLENVKNLVTHDNGKTFDIIKTALLENGYFIKYKVLNSKDYGNVPQNRERIYIVGFRDKDMFDNFEFPGSICLSKSVTDILEIEVDDKFYYTKDNFKHYDILEDSVKTGAVYQWRRHYVRENKSGVCPTLTANMGTGGHNVPIIRDNKGIRKITSRECFRLQGFDDDYNLPDIAVSHLYKQAGNSVTVSVIKRIADNILKCF